ncbi:hypothetical protein SDRG_07750 [Saprolegnia diclina VS20]|uniref:FYVE-type domain-containing protein n=1 Tax=Saprolegnia diclina (strain VS20) TaxID=1156394 RepID=T0RX43_SAPDV|nr:hypothetical protein SDRG_07750 [Saprolegnia diclina VS20]EQC34952.1 hypothetical protein SDRG_07750 [Saprolegnia diclina VS20]|eukprot:XP_008611824.1 hypothetical protein SDRG_07750 [Saprolegnia diclina VS20]
MDRFDVDELDFESVEPVRPSSFDGTSAQKFDIAIRARQALPSLSLTATCNTKLKQLDWRFVKKDKEVSIHRLEREKHGNSLTTRVSFRISVEIKSYLETIMDALVPKSPIEYLHMEKRMFPKFVDAAVLHQVEDDEISELPTYPRHCVKWHASHLLTNRITGRMGTPTDFVFEEFADVETIENVQCGFGYIQSCDYPEADLRRVSAIKCKRGLIRKGVFLVQPSAPDSVIHEVTAMYIMDFPKNLGISVDRIISAYADRLRNIREMLINTLFQPIPILPRDQWVDDRSRRECCVCTQTFTLVRARHHCRACGEVVCGNCSRKWSVPVKNNGELLTRLCTPCSLKARSNLMPSVVHTNRFSRSNTTLGLDPPMTDFEMHLHTSYHPHLNSLPLQKPIFHSVRVGAAASVVDDTVAAVEGAWHQLVTGPLQLNRPHFVLVNYSCAHDPYAIAETLHRLAPDLVFCGAALSMEKGDVTYFEGGVDGKLDKYPHLLSLWGLYDVDGSFTANGVGFQGIEPKEATRQCIKQSIVDLELGPTESPDMLWLMPTDGYEEPVVRTVEGMLDTSATILGATSKHSRLCGSGAHGVFVMTDDQPGIVLAMCSPSMQVTEAYFTCYEPNERVFSVTKADGKRLLELDHQPPLQVLKDGLDRNKRKLYMGSRQKVFPAFGRMQKGLGGDVYVQQIEPVGVHSDMSMTLAASIKRDDQLRLMSMDAKMIPDDIAAGLHASREEEEVIGCYVTVGASILQHLGDDAPQLRDAVLHGMGRNLYAAIAGNVSMTQIGIMTGAHKLSYGNGMVAALLVTNTKKRSVERRSNRAQRRSF